MFSIGSSFASRAISKSVAILCTHLSAARWEKNEEETGLPTQANIISIPENGSPFKGAGQVRICQKPSPAAGPAPAPETGSAYCDCQALGSSVAALPRASAMAAAKPRAKVTRLMTIITQLTPVISVRSRIATGDATTSPSTAQ